MTHSLRQALEEARQRLIEQEKVIESLTTPPFDIGTIVSITDDNTVLVAIRGSIIECIIPYKSDAIVPGRRARLSRDYAIVGLLPPLSLESGYVYTVRNVDGRYCEIDFAGSVRRVYADKVKVEKGDRVVVDEAVLTVIRNLGKADKEHMFSEETKISWDDIGGLEAAKREMIDAIESPYRYPEIYKKYNKKPPKGILLYGPPGCGKTMIGKAASTALANIHGESASTGFMYVKGPEILQKYIGESEAIIRRLFSSAREHKEKYKYPATIFIDEADAIMNRRGSGISSDVDRTIVPMFLTEMDGLSDSGAMVILATNRPDTLDPAIIREGRMDRKIEIPRPDQVACRSIARVHIKDKPISNGFTAEGLIDKAISLMFSPEFKMDLSGSAIAGIIDYALSSAISRDISSGKFSGLNEEDIEVGVNRVFIQNMHVSNEAPTTPDNNIRVYKKEIKKSRWSN